jgi:hypothetical protein
MAETCIRRDYITGYTLYVQMFAFITRNMCNFNTTKMLFYYMYICIIICQNTTQFYAQYVQISHNYMFRPILGYLQIVPFSLASVVA